jgi:hypothetical protein
MNAQFVHTTLNTGMLGEGIVKPPVTLSAGIDQFISAGASATSHDSLVHTGQALILLFSSRKRISSAVVGSGGRLSGAVSLIFGSFPRRQWHSRRSHLSFAAASARPLHVRWLVTPKRPIERPERWRNLMPGTSKTAPIPRRLGLPPAPTQPLRKSRHMPPETMQSSDLIPPGVGLRELKWQILDAAVIAAYSLATPAQLSREPEAIHTSSEARRRANPIDIFARADAFLDAIFHVRRAS